MTRFLAAGIWLLIVCWVISGPRHARASLEKGRAALAESRWPEQVEGCGFTTAKAQADAVRHAREVLQEVLMAEHGETAWAPDLEFVRRHLIRGPGVEGAPKEIVAAGGAKIKVKTWIYPLQRMPVETIQYHLNKEALDKEARQRRMGLTRFFLAGLLACFAVLGIVRLLGGRGKIAEKGSPPLPKRQPLCKMAHR